MMAVLAPHHDGLRLYVGRSCCIVMKKGVLGLAVEAALPFLETPVLAMRKGKNGLAALPFDTPLGITAR